MMDATLHLHVGMDKTGSTSIQATYSRLPPAPTRARWIGDGFNHWGLVAGAQVGAPASALAHLRETLAEEAARGGAAVASGENMSYFAPPVVLTLLEAAAPFDRVRGLAYVREPRGYLSSRLQQRVKVDRLPHDLLDEFPRYRNRLSPWALGLLHAGGMRFVRYDPEAFAEGDLLTDFAHRTGLATPSRLARRTGQNAGLSADAVAVIARYREETGPEPPPPAGTPGAAGIVVERAFEGFGAMRFEIDPALARDVGPVLRDQVAWMERRMGGLPVTEPRAERTWRDRESVLRHGEAVLPAYRDWLAARHPGLDPPEDVRGLVDAARARVAEVGAI